MGIYLPHVGATSPGEGQRRLEPWLIEPYLQKDSIEEFRLTLGLSLSGWERIMRRFVTVFLRHAKGESAGETAKTVGLSIEEAEDLIEVGREHRSNPLLQRLMQAYGRSDSSDSGEVIEDELIEEFGFSPVAARLYHEELGRLVGRLSQDNLPPGRTVFFAISRGSRRFSG